MDICFGVYVVWEYISYSEWIYALVYMSCGNTYHIVNGYMLRCICRVGIHTISSMDICFGVYVVWEYISYSEWIYASVYMSCGNTYHIVHGYMFRCISRVGIHII